MDQHHHYPGGAQRRPGFSRQPAPLQQGQPSQVGAPYKPATAKDNQAGNSPATGAPSRSAGSKKKRRRNGNSSSRHAPSADPQGDNLTPPHLLSSSGGGLAGIPYMASSNDAMMNAQETWHPFNGSQSSPQNASPPLSNSEGPATGPGSGKHLLRAKGSGQFSSTWPDEATCALVQQCCVNMKPEFSSSEGGGGQETWQKVADSLSHAGYRINRPNDPFFTVEDCKKKWQYIFKEAKKYKRRLAANEPNLRMPKVVAILGPNIQQELFDIIGPVEPATPADHLTSGSSHKKKKYITPQGDSFGGFGYLAPEHQYPASSLNFSVGQSSDIDPLATHTQSHGRHSQEPDSTERFHENGEAYSAEDYAHERRIRERKMLATEVLLTTARYNPEHKVTLSRAIKLLETRTETLVKVFDMCYHEGSGLEVSSFVSYMKVILAAEDRDY
eukprot:gb/GECG01013725.1/.p1 GENE.gb/GECG01013725.1/~~gb/GECG01013725.1/.p1  ORF type:complete len:443 (+),score=54.89 gb/GECG01013725.1/:1-1329(+)